VPCRAHENVVYAMAVNRVGEERGFRFIGRSSIVGTSGERLAMASPASEEILYAEIDPALARNKRLVRVPGRHVIDRMGDRRPEFYAPIVAANPLESSRQTALR
jgi:predicted amidohydrolase